MRPGQVSPGNCSEINAKKNFRGGETYGLANNVDPPLRPIARLPLPDLICVMESTPYLETLRTSLDLFLKRPSTIYNQQRHLVSACNRFSFDKIFKNFANHLKICIHKNNRNNTITLNN